MKKLLAVCLGLLLVLSLAQLYRWDYTASKTYPQGVVKWKNDRWTSVVWVELYGEKTKELPAFAAKDAINEISESDEEKARRAWNKAWYNIKNPGKTMPQEVFGEVLNSWETRNYYTKVWRYAVVVDLVLSSILIGLILFMPSRKQQHPEVLK